MRSGGVHVRFTKWDGSLHWHFDMTRLGADEHGVWLGAPQGTPVRRADEPPITSPAFAVLFPKASFWAAAFNAPMAGSPFGYLLYVDICTPAEWSDGMVTAIDLDLDVVRALDGTVAVHDEDEFDEHRVRFSYPDHIVAAARSAAAVTLAAIDAGREPFDGVGEAWLQQAVELG
jgi:uncharacterized protein